MKRESENESGSSNVRQSVNVQARAIIHQLLNYGLVGLTFVSFFPGLFHIQEYAFFFLFAVALSFSWVDKINPFIRTPIDLPLFGFLGWVLCTIPFAIDPAYSFSEWRKFVAHVCVFYWGMFVLRQYRSVDLPQQILWAVVLGSLTLSGFALVDFALRGGTWRDRLIRAGAPNSDYNWLTTYLVLTIPILIAWILVQKTLCARALGIVTVLTAGLAQIAAYTRAGWMAHFAQALGFVLIARRQRLIMWILVGAITTGGGLIAISAIGYQRDTMDPWTFSARVKTWQLGLQQVIQHPVVGIGYGNDTFVRMYAAEIEGDKSKGAEEKILPALHNTFAMVLMGSGVPALVFFLWILARAVRELSSGTRELISRRAGVPLFALAIALAVIGFAVRNAFDYMFAGSLASLFWILVALGFSIKNDSSLQVKTQ